MIGRRTLLGLWLAATLGLFAPAPAQAPNEPPQQPFLRIEAWAHIAPVARLATEEVSTRAKLPCAGLTVTDSLRLSWPISAAPASGRMRMGAETRAVVGVVRTARRACTWPFVPGEMVSIALSSEIG